MEYVVFVTAGTIAFDMDVGVVVLMAVPADAFPLATIAGGTKTKAANPFAPGALFIPMPRVTVDMAFPWLHVREQWPVINGTFVGTVGNVRSGAAKVVCVIGPA